MAADELFDPKGDIAYAKPALQSFEAALPSLFVASVPTCEAPPALSVRTGGQHVDRLTISLKGASGISVHAANVVADGRWRQVVWQRTANAHAANR